MVKIPGSSDTVDVEEEPAEGEAVPAARRPDLTVGEKEEAPIQLAQANTGTISDAVPPEADPLARLQALSGAKIDTDYQKRLADRSNADALKWLSSVGEESGTPILPDETEASGPDMWAGSQGLVSGAKAVGKAVAGDLGTLAGRDMGNVIVGGPLNAVANTLDLVDQGIAWLKANGIDVPEALRDPNAATGRFADLVPNPAGVRDQPKSVTGGFLQAIAQFMTGFGMAGKVTGIGNSFAGAMTKGAIADFSAFKGEDPNLANLLLLGEPYAPGLRNVVTEFLASDKETPDVVGRLKNVLAGAVPNVLIPPLIGGLRMIRERRRAQALGQDISYEEASQRLAKGGLETGEAPATQVGSRIDELLGKPDEDLVKVVEKQLKPVETGIPDDVTARWMYEQATKGDWKPSGVDAAPLDSGAAAAARPKRGRKPNIEVEGNTYRIKEKGFVVAEAELSADRKSVKSVLVMPEHRRKGLATALYNRIEADLGYKLQPSASALRDDGFKFWQGRDPSAVADDLRARDADVKAFVESKHPGATYENNGNFVKVLDANGDRIKSYRAEDIPQQESASPSKMYRPTPKPSDAPPADLSAIKLSDDEQRELILASLSKTRLIAEAAKVGEAKQSPTGTFDADAYAQAQNAAASARKSLIIKYGAGTADALIDDVFREMDGVQPGLAKSYDEVAGYVRERFGVDAAGPRDTLNKGLTPSEHGSSAAAAPVRLPGVSPDITFDIHTNAIGQTNVSIMKDGEQIGRAYVRHLKHLKPEDVVIQLGNIHLDRPFRRKGIMTALQEHLEKRLGAPAAPDVSLSQAELQRWQKIDPEAVRNYRPTSKGSEVYHNSTEPRYDTARMNKVRREIEVPRDTAAAAALPAQKSLDDVLGPLDVEKRAGHFTSPEHEEALDVATSMLQVAPGTDQAARAVQSIDWALANGRRDIAEAIVRRAEDVSERSNTTPGVAAENPKYAEIEANLQRLKADADAFAKELREKVGAAAALPERGGGNTVKGFRGLKGPFSANAVDDKVQWFSADEKTAKAYGDNVVSARLDLGKTFEVDAWAEGKGSGIWYEIPLTERQAKDLSIPTGRSRALAPDGYAGLFSTDDIAHYAKAAGYDSVRIKNVGDGASPTEVFGVFDKARASGLSDTSTRQQAKAPGAEPSTSGGGSIPPDGGGIPPGSGSSGGPPQGPFSRDVYINWSKIDAPDAVKRISGQMADAYAEEIAAKGRGRPPQTWKETAAKAGELNAFEVLLGQRKGEIPNAAEMHAMADMYVASKKKLYETVQAAAQGGGPEEMIAMRHMMSVHRMIQAEVLGAGSEAARTLNILRKVQSGSQEYQQQLTRLLEQTGGADTNRALAEAMADLMRHPDGAAKVDEFLKKGTLAKSVDTAIEAWKAGLLSGPMTHIYNVIGNSVVLPASIAERAIASRISSVLSPVDGVVVGEASIMAWSTVKHLKDAFRALGTSFRTNEQQWGGANQGEAPSVSRISSEHWEVPSNSMLGRGIDMLGTAYTLPFRGLGAMDAFFKHIHYHNELEAAAYRMATHEMERGQIPAEQFATRLKELLDEPPEALRMSAKDFAEYNTFTNPPGKWTKHLIDARNDDNPIVRALMHKTFAFVQTPANILKFSFERTPAGILSTKYQHEIKQGGHRKDMALAKLGLGTAAMAVAYDLATDGFITGSGPEAPNKKALLLRSGWKPYSIRVIEGEREDGTPIYRYYPIQRFDPIASPLLWAAELADIASHKDGRLDVEWEEAFSLATMSSAELIMNKSTMMGFSDLVEAVHNPKRLAESYWLKSVASLVPAGVNFVAKTMDPVQRQTWDAMSAVKSRLPGLSKDLPPALTFWAKEKRYESGLTGMWDWVFPTSKSTKDANPVDREFYRLDYIPTHQGKISVAGTPIEESISAIPGAEKPKRKSDAERSVAIPLRNMRDVYNKFIVLSADTPASELVNANRHEMVTKKGADMKLLRDMQGYGHLTMYEVMSEMIEPKENSRLPELSLAYKAASDEEKRWMLKDVVRRFHATATMQVRRENPKLQIIRDGIPAKAGGDAPF